MVELQAQWRRRAPILQRSASDRPPHKASATRSNHGLVMPMYLPRQLWGQCVTTLVFQVRAEAVRRSLDKPLFDLIP